MKRRRVCRKPGENYDGHIVYRSASPYLERIKDNGELNECPIGFVLRNGVHIYDALPLDGYVETGGVSPFELSPWARQAMNIVASERARHRELDRQKKQAKADAKYGAQMIRGK